MEIQNFCQAVKRHAKQFRTFDEFHKNVRIAFPKYKTIVKENEMKRLISVASVEANHI